MANNICFLDFDGVFVNTHKAFLIKSVCDPTAAAILSKVLEEFNFKIVVSSTWRLGASRLELHTYLRLCGIKAKIHENFCTCQMGAGFNRGDEIEHWLLNCKEKVDNYIIIDDDSDMLQKQMSQFIHVDGREGFSVADYYKIKSLFISNNDNKNHKTTCISEMRPFHCKGIGGGLRSYREIYEEDEHSLSFTI